MLDIYFIYFDKLQHKLFYNCKVLENMALKKTFQSYSFGDQKLTEPLLHRHIHSYFYFNNTFNYGNGLFHAVISRGCSSHQFKLRKEHKSRMDTRLLVISMSSRNVHLIITRTQLLQELFLPWDCNCAMENLPPEIIASTLPCSFG